MLFAPFSKCAIHTLTKVFAHEFAAPGMTVNAVAPGPLDLPVVHRLVPPERMDSLIATIPVGRLGDHRRLLGRQRGLYLL